MIPMDTTRALWKRLVARIKNVGEAVLLAIASEEVFLNRLEYDKRLSRSAKHWYGGSSPQPRRAA